MESKGTIESSSCYKCTSHNKLLKSALEVVELWELQSSEVEHYKVQICWEQDYDEIDAHFEVKHNADLAGDSTVKDYRFYDYSDVPDEVKSKFRRKTATWLYCWNWLCWCNCIKSSVITPEFMMTYEFGDKSKPNLVFIHGWLGWSMNNFKIYKYLEKDFHIYTFDLVGFGASSRPDFLAKNWHEAEEFFIQIVEKWREKIGITDFNLVGHSLGGYISAKYTLRYPQYVKKLSLWSPLGVERIPSIPRKYFKKQMKYLWWLKCFLWCGFTTCSKLKFNVTNLSRFFGMCAFDWMAKPMILKFLGPVTKSQLKVLCKYQKQIILTKESSERWIPYLMKNYIMSPNPILDDLETFKSNGTQVWFAYGEFGKDFLNTDFSLKGKSISDRLKEMGYLWDEYKDAEHCLQVFAPKPVADRLIEFFLERDDVQKEYTSRK